LFGGLGIDGNNGRLHACKVKSQKSRKRLEKRREISVKNAFPPRQIYPVPSFDLLTFQLPFIL
jgi:hypothetical protein